MKSSPSCSVNVDPNEITFDPPDFDPHADKSVTVKILKTKLVEVSMLAARQPQTDAILRTLGKKKSLLESAITSFSDIESLPVRTYRKKEKRQQKAMRRKAARADEVRKISCAG